MSSRILDVDDVERSRKAFTVSNNSDTSNVTSSGDHGKISGLELDKIGDLSGLKVKNKTVVSLKEKSG